MQKTALCDRITAFGNPPDARYSRSGSLGQKPPSRRFLTKMLLIMKLFIVFMMAGLLQVQAKTYSQTITFSGKNVAITRVFKAIENQTGYAVFANKELLRDAKPVSLAVSNMPLNDFLSAALAEQPIGFEIHNRTIFITARKLPASGEPTLTGTEEEKPLYAEVTGRVTGSDGQPLSGATVSIKGARASAVTNEDGRYSIDVLPGQTLVFSYVGFKSLEVPVGYRTSIDVTMEKLVGEID